MLKDFLPLPQLFTAFAQRAETLDNLTQLPELQNTHLVEMAQVHGSKVAQITDKTKLTSKQLASVDAMLTTRRDVALVVRVADCVPILLYHQPSETIGIIHAGRKGTEQSITQQTLSQLPSTKGPLYVWLGPHICEQCYQINPETNEHYNLLRQNLNQMYQVFEKSELQLHFDPHCTVHHNGQFYSYRKEGDGVPMNYGVISFNQVA